MNEEEVLIKYIKEKYSQLEDERKSIGDKSNIKRYTMPTMSQYVENAVAILINQILEKNSKEKYNYYIDPQLSVEGKLYRPDIIIYDNNNVIHGIVEVKSQLGYVNIDQTAQTYKEKIDRIKKVGENGTISVKKIEEDFSVSKKCKDMIVILMSANSHGKIKEGEIKGFEDINYFILFDETEKKKDQELWYNSIEDYLNIYPKRKHTYTKFVEFLKKNF